MAGRGPGPPARGVALASRDRALEGAVALPLVPMTGGDGPLLLRQQRDLGRQVAQRGARRPAMTRRTSRAVTTPSPEVVCSRTMTWPLFSPPSADPLTCIPSRMYLSPTGVRMTCPPAASTTVWRPPFERTDTTSPPLGSTPRASRSRARMPRTWSPSTTVAGRIDGDEPVGVAVEGEADVGAARATTSAASEAGAVAPARTLMFTPSGSLWMTSTWAPVAARISGPTTPPEPLAQSRTMRMSRRDRAGEGEPRRAIALEQAARIVDPAELGVADARRAPRTAR